MRKVQCESCQSKGWVLSAKDWPVRCSLCEGRGSISLHSIAIAMDEDPEVLHRLSEQRVQSKTARRLLDKLLISVITGIKSNRPKSVGRPRTDYACKLLNFIDHVATPHERALIVKGAQRDLAEQQGASVPVHTGIKTGDSRNA